LIAKHFREKFIKGINLAFDPTSSEKKVDTEIVFYRGGRIRRAKALKYRKIGYNTSQLPKM